MTLYEKVGKRYKPVGQIVNHDFLPIGCYLVIVDKTGRVTKRIDNPDYIGFVAAAEKALQPMIDAIVNASELKPNGKLSRKEREAYRAYKKIVGEKSIFTLKRASAYEIACAGIDAVRNFYKGGLFR